MAAKKKTAAKSSKTTKKTASKATKKSVVKTRDMTELVDLTPEAVQALSKPRDKFEDHMESLFELYAAHGDKLGKLAVGIDEARERLGRYKELAPEEAAARTEAEAANKKVEMLTETRAIQASTVWGVMLDIYGKAKQAAKSDAAIAAQVKPFAAFMATGPRK